MGNKGCYVINNNPRTTESRWWRTASSPTSIHDQHNLQSFNTIVAKLFEKFNPVPDMPILGSSDSTANKDMMSKILTNDDTIF